jgi:hypothetical protein
MPALARVLPLVLVLGSLVSGLALVVIEKRQRS